MLWSPYLTLWDVQNVIPTGYFHSGSCTVKKNNICVKFSFKNAFINFNFSWIIMCINFYSRTGTNNTPIKHTETHTSLEQSCYSVIESYRAHCIGLYHKSTLISELNIWGNKRWGQIWTQVCFRVKVHITHQFHQIMRHHTLSLLLDLMIWNIPLLFFYSLHY